MAHYQKYLCTLLLLVLSLSCQQNDQQNLQKDARLLAELRCEAEKIKEERFRVANEFRFKEDSLMKLKLRLSEREIAQFDSVKTALTLTTTQMAEKIDKIMDSLFTTTYKTIPQRDSLDATTERMMKEICH
ncbi:MAG: hypothetical protein ACK4GN_08970 [Runella sp.]